MRINRIKHQALKSSSYTEAPGLMKELSTTTTKIPTSSLPREDEEEERGGPMTALTTDIMSLQTETLPRTNEELHRLNQREGTSNSCHCPQH